MIKKQVIAGDTFSIVYYHKQGDTIADLPEGYDYVIGLRQEDGKTVTSFKYSKNEIQKIATGTYRWQIDYELSKTLKDVVIAEMLVYSIDKAFVQHCNEPIRIEVIPSFMNNVIEEE